MRLIKRKVVYPAKIDKDGSFWITIKLRPSEKVAIESPIGKDKVAVVHFVPPIKEKYKLAWEIMKAIPSIEKKIREARDPADKVRWIITYRHSVSLLTLLTGMGVENLINTGILDKELAEYYLII